MKRKIRDFYLINQIIMSIFFNIVLNYQLSSENLLSEQIKGG